EVAHHLTNTTLDDEYIGVRVVAVRHFEKYHDTSSLIQALYNSAPEVRRIAAWYTGKQRVAESGPSLLQRLYEETDTEALRAIIWSLGVLRLDEAKSVLETMQNHSEPSIRLQAQETLAKFT
ncbi:MAG: HEAT repeat domain-containing protein, partial [Chloroflexota bacterium]